MTKDLKQRIDETYSQLGNEQRTLAGDIETSFPEYFTGREMQPTQPLLDRMAQGSKDKEEASLIMDYAFLNCVQSRIPEVVTKFISLYDKFKHNSSYTLCNFLLNWNQETQDFEGEKNRLGSFSPLLIGIVNHLERTRELQGFLYGEDSGYLAEISGVAKMGLVSVIAKNSELIEKIVAESLPKDQTTELKEILSGERLVSEAAQAFLDAYPHHKDSPLYQRGLEVFLDRYDLSNHRFTGKIQGGQYRTLLYSLVQKHRAGWKRAFFELLDDPIRERVMCLDQELGKKGIREEDRIRFVERLMDQDLIKYVQLLAEDGADAEEILLAAKIESLSPSERKMLHQVTSKGKRSLGKYLGLCRVNARNTALSYDARRSLRDLCNVIDPRVFAGNETLAAILLEKSKQQYEESFVEDNQATIDKLKQEIEDEKNPVQKELLKRTLRHYDLRRRISNVEGFKKKLTVIR